MKKSRPPAVTSFGIYWERDAEWSSTKLYGEHLPDPINKKKQGVVNFAEQDAVYLLHRDREIVYVGKTVGHTSGLAERLRAHTRSPTLHSRWNRFSWFGFREVDHDSVPPQLGKAKFPKSFGVTDLVSIIEAVLIEAVEPRNNRQGGVGFKDLAYGQVSAAEAKKMLKGIP